MFSKALVAAYLTRALLVNAQGSSGAAPVPLASQTFSYDNLPYQADPNDGERGHQAGYNICNSTTENQQSLCQTAVINSIDDFCLWGPVEPNSVIGNVEGECVAWCTKAGHGTRIMPAGTITGVTFMRTPAYIQVTGTIKQDNINIEASDSGGELDPHGADQRGNPLGGLLFTNAWSGGGSNYIQAIEWHNFMGGNMFCLKACDPSGSDDANYCQHIFDRIGCQYNAPGNYTEGVFQSCLGENQDFPGVYTGADGVVSTYTQPPEDAGPINTINYTPRMPASSSCTQYESASLFAGAPAATNAATSGLASGTRTTGGSSTRTSSSATRSNSASQTGAALAGAQPAGALVGLLGGLAALFL